MQHQEFSIGINFEMSGKHYRCTDIGTRTVVAICLEHPEDPSWYDGPPYAIEEIVLDEFDIEVCKPSK